MKKQSLILVCLFTLRVNGMISEHFFWELVHRDCFTLQSGTNRISQGELRQRLIKLESMEESLDRTVNIFKIGLSISAYRFFKEPGLIINICQTGYADIAFSTALVAGYYLYSRDQALKEVKSNLLAELSRLTDGPPAVQITKTLTYLKQLPENPSRQP